MLLTASVVDTGDASTSGIVVRGEACFIGISHTGEAGITFGLLLAAGIAGVIDTAEVLSDTNN